jgi:hypothetical protein
MVRPHPGSRFPTERRRGDKAKSPRLGDFNEDLVAFGIDERRAILRPQVKPADVDRFHLAAPSGRL